MKKHHTTFVLLALFFTGLIVLWWTNYVGVPTSQELELNRHLVLPQLAKISLGDITRLTIDPRSDRDETEEPHPVQLIFERRGDAWQMIEPINAAADSPRLDRLVQSLKNLTKSSEAGTIHDPGAKFGLDPAAAAIKVFGHDFKTPLASLEVGKAFRDQLYVRPNGKSEIEVVEARFFQGINDQPLAWREKSLFNLATFQVGGLTVAGPGRALEAERIGGHWRLIRPIRALGNDDKMEGVLGELTSLRVVKGDEGFVADDVKDRARYGLDKDQAIRVELRPVLSRAKPQEILIGKAVPNQDDKFYAMQVDQDDVVTISSKGLRDLGVDPNALRSTTVADFDPARAHFIRIEALGRTFDMARTEQGWSIVRPTRSPADHQLVATLLTKLQELQTSEFFSASKVSTPGLDPASISLKLWQLKPGERLPKAAVDEPTGDLKVSLNLGRHDVLKKSVYAQVAGDPTILVVPDTFLEALPQNELAFRERNLINLSPGQVSRLTVVRDGKTIVLAPPSSGDPNQWRMEQPVDAPADVEAVTKALMMLNGLRAQRLITDKPTNLRPFGLDSPSMTITWSSASSPSAKRDGSEATQSLRIGHRLPKSESWYASLSDSPLVFVLSDAVVLPFRAEFRSRRVLSFSPRQVERLTLRWPERSLSFEHHPTPRGGVSDWDPAPGTKRGQFDLSRIHSLATELAKLNTRTFIQYDGPFPEASGLSSPQLTVEYTLKGDKKTHALRVGRRYEEGEYYATTADKNEGMVFALGGTGWADLLRPSSERKTAELPEDVFAPDPAPGEK